MISFVKKYYIHDNNESNMVLLFWPDISPTFRTVSVCRSFIVSILSFRPPDPRVTITPVSVLTNVSLRSGDLTVIRDVIRTFYSGNRSPYYFAFTLHLCLFIFGVDHSLPLRGLLNMDSWVFSNKLFTTFSHLGGISVPFV